MSIGEVLSRAFGIFFKHKALWLFGLLAGISGGLGGGVNYSYSFDTSANSGMNSWLAQLVDAISAGHYPVETILRIAVVLFILWSLILLLISVVGRVGVVRGAWVAEEGYQVPVNWLGSEARRLYSKAVWLVLLGQAPVLLGTAFLMFGMPALMNDSVRSGRVGDAFALVCLGGVFLLALAIAVILLNFSIEFGLVSLTNEGYGIGASLSRGWGLVRRNLGQVIILALVLGAVQLLVMALVLIAFVPLLMDAFHFRINLTDVGSILAGGLLGLPFSLFTYALISGFAETVWMVAFRRLLAHEAMMAYYRPPAYVPPPPGR
jgi:hypothetical protein